jgi:hypothetical protein
LRAHWALHELGLDYECRPILPRTGETQTREYTELNPRQKIPLLQDGDFKIAESPAIAAYLSHSYGTRENALIPSEPREYATWCESASNRDPIADPYKQLICGIKLQPGGVPSGTDRDPSFQKIALDISKAYCRFGRGPASVPIYNNSFSPKLCPTWMSTLKTPIRHMQGLLETWRPGNSGLHRAPNVGRDHRRGPPLMDPTQIGACRPASFLPK